MDDRLQGGDERLGASLRRQAPPRESAGSDRPRRQPRSSRRGEDQPARPLVAAGQPINPYRPIGVNTNGYFTISFPPLFGFSNSHLRTIDKMHVERSLSCNPCVVAPITPPLGPM